MNQLILSFSTVALLSSCVVQLPSEPVTPPASTSSQTTVTPVEPTPYVTKREAYTGTIGNSKVRSELSFYSNGTVIGNYVSFESGKKYLLKGNNHFADKLVLKESSQDKYGTYRETSVSDLRQTSPNLWEGTMRNYDGRNVPVKLKRAN